MKAASQSYRYCGRDFSGTELEKVRQIIASDDRPNRVKISRRVCEAFGMDQARRRPQGDELSGRVTPHGT